MRKKRENNPKIIHRIYFENFKPFHDPFQHYLETWRRELPEYEIKLWGPSNLDVDATPWTKLAYEKKSPVFLSEYFRWKLLAEYGGVYLDADCEILNGRIFRGIIDELYEQDDYDCFFGVEEMANGHPTAQTFGAKKESDLVSFMIDLYENRLEPLWHWRETRGLIGPQLMSLYFLNRNINGNDDGFFKNIHQPIVSERAKVYPQRFFSPKFSLLGDVLDYDEGDTCIYHMFANSNVDFASNKKMEAARQQALTFSEYRSEIEKISQFPRLYHSSHFSVREGIHTDEGIRGDRSGLLMYGPYVSLPSGRYIARIECSRRPKKGAATLSITSGSGATNLASKTVNFSAADAGTLEIGFEIRDDVAHMCEITLAVDGIDGILVTNASIDKVKIPVFQPVTPDIKIRPSLKRIHRVYFGFDGKPDPFGRYLETWKRQLPDFEIMHWDASNLPIDANEYVRKLYKEKDHAFLTDYFRWYLLREYGGSYFDADLEVINGSKYSQLISELENASKFDAFIGIDERNGGWYTAHSMASKAGSALACYMCEIYDSFGKFTAWRREGMYFWAPQLVGLYFSDKGFHKQGMGTMPHLSAPQVIERVKIYPQDWFSPLAPTGVAEKPFNLSGYSENTTLCHHFACSWHEEGSIYLPHAQERAGQQKVLLKELVQMEGLPILTERYKGDAMHMSFVPAGNNICTAVGVQTGLGYATTGREGYLVYGLSQPATKGNYRASFYLDKITAIGDIGIEITSNQGLRSIGAIKILIPENIGRGIVYCDFKLDSNVVDLDCRLTVDSSCELFCSELAIDRVPL